MEAELRNKMIHKARENGEKHGKAAELDFGAGAEWMYEKIFPTHEDQPIYDFAKQVKELVVKEWGSHNLDAFVEEFKRD